MASLAAYRIRSPEKGSASSACSETKEEVCRPKVRPRRRFGCQAAPGSGREGTLCARQHQKKARRTQGQAEKALWACGGTRKVVAIARVRLPEEGQRQEGQCGHQGRECRSGLGLLRKVCAQRRSDGLEEPNAQQKGSRREECSQAVCAARSRNRLRGA